MRWNVAEDNNTNPPSTEPKPQNREQGQGVGSRTEKLDFSKDAKPIKSKGRRQHW